MSKKVNKREKMTKNCENKPKTKGEPPRVFKEK